MTLYTSMVAKERRNSGYWQKKKKKIEEVGDDGYHNVEGIES